MAVKAAVSEVGGLHNVGDANAAKAFGAEQCAGRIDDAVAVQGGLFAAYSHCTSAMRRPTSLDNLYDDRHQ